MLTIAAVLFALAALGGITLATLHLRHRAVPMTLALGHGLLAAAGLVVLIAAVASGSRGNLVIASLALFLIAALGGFALFSFHLRRQPLPTPLGFIHACVAIVAFLLLLVGIARGA